MRNKKLAVIIMSRYLFQVRKLRRSSGSITETIGLVSIVVGVVVVAIGVRPGSIGTVVPVGIGVTRVVVVVVSSPSFGIGLSLTLVEATGVSVGRQVVGVSAEGIGSGVGTIVVSVTVVSVESCIVAVVPRFGLSLSLALVELTVIDTIVGIVSSISVSGVGSVGVDVGLSGQVSGSGSLDRVGVNGSDGSIPVPDQVGVSLGLRFGLRFGLRGGHGGDGKTSENDEFHGDDLVVVVRLRSPC